MPRVSGQQTDLINCCNKSCESFRRTSQPHGHGIPSHACSMYPLLASGTDAAYVAVFRLRALPLSAADASETGPRRRTPNIVFLSQPKRPETGAGPRPRCRSRARLHGRVPHSSAVVVVDKAYAELAHDGALSALSPVAGPRALDRLTHHVQGLRPGQGQGSVTSPPLHRSPKIHAASFRIPFHLSALAQATADAALRRVEALLANVKGIKSQRRPDRRRADPHRLDLLRESDSSSVGFGGLENPAVVVSKSLVEDHNHRRAMLGVPSHLRVTAEQRSRSHGIPGPLGRTAQSGCARAHTGISSLRDCAGHMQSPRPMPHILVEH